MPNSPYIAAVNAPSGELEAAVQHWRDMTAEAANLLTVFFRQVLPQLTLEDRKELEVAEIEKALKKHAVAQDSLLRTLGRVGVSER